jgi:D-Tyr-tRNAtyr deacylase
MRGNMRAVLQRVSEARVEVEGRVTGEIGRGLLVCSGLATGIPVRTWSISFVRSWDYEYLAMMRAR